MCNLCMHCTLFAVENDSFMSDDDALSEPQLLAMLAEIECKYLVCLLIIIMTANYNNMTYIPSCGIHVYPET